MVEGFLSKGTSFFLLVRFLSCSNWAQWAQWEQHAARCARCTQLHICAMPAWDGVPLPVKEIRNSARASGPGALSGHPTIWVFFFLCCSTPSTKALGQLVGQLIFFFALCLGGRPTATKNFNLPPYRLFVHSWWPKRNEPRS